MMDCAEKDIMHSLQKIKGLKSQGGDYLGIATGFLVEVRDHDPVVNALLPGGIKFERSSRHPYQGRKRLILSNPRGTILVMIKNGKKVEGLQHPELYVFINKSQEKDSHALTYITALASTRWPNGILTIKKKSLKKMPENFESLLRATSWHDLKNGTTDIAFQLKLHV